MRGHQHDGWQLPEKRVLVDDTIQINILDLRRRGLFTGMESRSQRIVWERRGRVFATVGVTLEGEPVTGLEKESASENSIGAPVLSGAGARTQLSLARI